MADALRGEDVSVTDPRCGLPGHGPHDEGKVMFTGIVESVGTVASIEDGDATARLTISC